MVLVKLGNRRNIEREPKEFLDRGKYIVGSLSVYHIGLIPYNYEVKSSSVFQRYSLRHLQYILWQQVVAKYSGSQKSVEL